MEIDVSDGIAFPQRASRDMPVNSASTFNLPFNSAIAPFLNISSIEMYSYIINRASIRKHHILLHVRIYDWAKD
jgi:hypothetical protein